MISIPGKGTCVGCGFGLSWGACGKQATDVSCSVFLSLSLSLSLLPFIWNQWKYPQVRTFLKRRGKEKKMEFQKY